MRLPAKKTETRFCASIYSLVVSLPELHGPNIGGDEDGTTQEGV